MDEGRIETAIGAGPMATLSETWPTEARQGRGPAREPSLGVELAWADHASRTLLVMALGVSGVLTGYGISLYLTPPADLGASLVIEALSLTLLVLAVLVAPSDSLHRLITLGCVLLHGIGALTLVWMRSTDVFSATTYGTLDALSFATFAMLVIAWLVLRMRHPVTIIAGLLAFIASAGTFWVRVLPVIRERMFASPDAEILSIADESAERGVVFALMLAVLVLAWWLDAWIRTAIPMRVEVAADDESTPDDGTLRVSVILMLCCIDVVALPMAIGVKRRGVAGGLSAADDWMATAIIGVSTAKLVLGIVAVAMVALWLADPLWRS